MLDIKSVNAQWCSRPQVNYPRMTCSVITRTGRSAVLNFPGQENSMPGQEWPIQLLMSCYVRWASNTGNST